MVQVMGYEEATWDYRPMTRDSEGLRLYCTAIAGLERSSPRQPRRALEVVGRILDGGDSCRTRSDSSDTTVQVIHEPALQRDPRSLRVTPSYCAGRRAVGEAGSLYSGIFSPRATASARRFSSAREPAKRFGIA